MLVLFWFNPAQHSFYPRCLFHALTGLHCPGCGALRALHHLSRGDLQTALHFNPLVVLAAPVFLAWQARNFLGKKPAPAHVNVFARPVVGWSLVALVVVFSIVRNLPFAPFTSLAP